jgi:hypothetical protein
MPGGAQFAAGAVDPAQAGGIQVAADRTEFLLQVLKAGHGRLGVLFLAAVAAQLRDVLQAAAQGTFVEAGAIGRREQVAQPLLHLLPDTVDGPHVGKPQRPLIDVGIVLESGRQVDFQGVMHQRGQRPGAARLG